MGSQKNQSLTSEKKYWLFFSFKYQKFTWKSENFSVTLSFKLYVAANQTSPIVEPRPKVLISSGHYGSRGCGEFEQGV